MSEEELKDRIAHLESVNDQLQAEIAYIDDLMKLLGFTEGLETVKGTAQDIYRGAEEDVSEDEIE